MHVHQVTQKLETHYIQTLKMASTLMSTFLSGIKDLTIL